MKVICVINEKGGTGKTASSINIAAELRARGKRVLCIDLDPQRNMSTTWESDDSALNVADVLLRGAKVHDAIQKKDERPDLIAGSPEAKQFESKNVFGAEFILHDALAGVNNEYDYAIIDTPPFIAKLATSGLVAADFAIVPASAESYSLDGLMQLNETIASVRSHGSRDKNLKLLGILLTRYRGNLKLTQGMENIMRLVAEQIGTKIFDARIRESVSIKEAIAMKKSCREYDKSCGGAKDYKVFVDELLNEMEE